MMDNLQSLCSIEAEQAVLGALLTNPNSWDYVAEILKPEQFFRREHNLIFRGIAHLATAAKAYDALCVMEQLNTWGDLADAGGLPFLAELAAYAPGSANLAHYANIIRERAQYRGLMAAYASAGDDLASPEGTLAGKAEKAIQRIQDAIDTVGDGEDVPLIRAALPAWHEDMTRRFEAKGDMVGLATNFIDLDSTTLGLGAGELIILAARPAMGKSTLAQNIVEHVCLNGKSAFVASLEMPRDMLINRMVSSLGRIDHGRVRSGKLEEDEWPRMTRAVTDIRDQRLAVDDRCGLTLDQLRVAAKRHKRKYGLDLLVLDYLQLMTIHGRKNGTRENDVSELTRGLKILAKDLSVPLIALSQLNRSLEARGNKRPMMSDLRESGSIEQDADVILFLYRDVVYNPQTDVPNYAELIIAKQRNGALATIPLFTRLSFCRFENALASDLPEHWNDPDRKPNNVTTNKRPEPK